MLIAGQRFREAMRREERFNPYHDELGRFTTADGTVVPGSGRKLGDGGSSSEEVAGDGSVQVAQAQGRGPGNGHYRDVVISPSAPVQTQILFARSAAIGATAKVREVDPTWRGPTSVSSGSGTWAPEQELAHYNTIFRAAQARLGEIERGGFGHNRGSSLEPLRPGGGTGAPPSGPPAFSTAYRSIMAMPDLTGPEAASKEDGTVAVLELGDFPVFGVNSGAPGHDDQDDAAAYSLRSTLIAKYPSIMDTTNIGRYPNAAVFHAEATVLLRAARVNRGSLAGRDLEVRVDRPRCPSCDLVLPKIGLELGNPKITFVSPNGSRRTMHNGRWQD